MGLDSNSSHFVAVWVEYTLMLLKMPSVVMATMLRCRRVLTLRDRGLEKTELMSPVSMRERLLQPSVEHSKGALVS